MKSSKFHLVTSIEMELSNRSADIGQTKHNFIKVRFKIFSINLKYSF